MRYEYLGTSNLKVSKICLGTMTFGEQVSENLSFDLLNFANEKGINFIDTAEMYPVYPKKETHGDTERIIGKWIKEKKNRDDIIIASKIASGHPKGIGATELAWIRKGGKNLSFDKTNINNAIDDTLKRLQTDYIDLYQLHWPERNVAIFGELDFKYDPNDNNWTPIQEVLENLNELVKTGKVRHIGLSNETPWGILNFLKISEEKKLPRVISVQNGYNLVNRVFDIANSEVSLRERCSLLAYSPLAGGRLSGKYANGNKPQNSRFTLWPKRFSRHHTERGEKAIDKYIKLSKKFNISSSQLANAFVINRPFVASSIIGVTSINHLKENIDSININFTEEMFNEIEEIHKSDPNPCL